LNANLAIHLAWQALAALKVTEGGTMFRMHCAGPASHSASEA
jgi:hypothetical protein